MVNFPVEGNTPRRGLRWRIDIAKTCTFNSKLISLEFFTFLYRLCSSNWGNSDKE